MYNIVLDEHLFVKANNLFCETLHPTNPWAQLYLCGASEEDCKKYIDSFNSSMKINHPLKNKKYLQV